MYVSMGRTEVLHLYKLMMRESQKFPAYNYKNYALRRVRDGFKEFKSLENAEIIEEKIKLAENNLAMLKRQATIGQMYQTHKSVIESTNK